MVNFVVSAQLTAKVSENTCISEKKTELNGKLRTEIPLDRNTFKHTVDRHGVVRLHAFDFRFYTELGNINRIQLLDIFHDTLQGVMVYLIGFIVRKVKIRGDGKRFQNLNSIIESTYFLRGRVNFKPNLEIRGSGYQKLEFYQVLNSNNTNYS